MNPPEQASPPEQIILNASYRSGFLQKARQMLEDKVLLDLTIQNGDKEWEIHSFVAAACSLRIREDLKQLPRPNFIEIEGDQEALEKIIFFMYNGYCKVKTVEELEVS